MVVRLALRFGQRLQPVEVPAVRLDSVEIAHRRKTGLIRPRIGPGQDTSCQIVKGSHGCVGHPYLGVVIYRPRVEVHQSRNDASLCDFVKEKERECIMNAATGAQPTSPPRQASADPQWVQLQVAPRYHRRPEYVPAHGAP